MPEVAKTGEKQKHVPIPTGWERVTIGDCQKGDKWLNLSDKTFCDAEEHSDWWEPDNARNIVGIPASMYAVLIRKIG